jgi:hypothetical protein
MLHPPQNGAWKAGKFTGMGQNFPACKKSVQHSSTGQLRYVKLAQDSRGGHVDISGYRLVGSGSCHRPRGTAQTLQQLQRTPMDSLPPSLHHAFENIKYHAKDILSAISGCMWQPESRLKINGRMCAYAIIHLYRARTQQIY